MAVIILKILVLLLLLQNSCSHIVSGNNHAEKSSLVHNDRVTIKPRKFLEISKNDLQNAIEIAKDQVAKLATFEFNIQESGITVDKSSPFYGQMIDFLPSDEAINNTKTAFIVIKASQQLASKFCFSSDEVDECIKYINSLKLTETSVGKICLDIYQNIKCDKEAKYRTVDGSCNNLQKPSWGKSNTAYKRILKATYEDGLYSIRSSSVDGKGLLSPRLVSTSISKSEHVSDMSRTQAMAIWGMFVAYDMAYTPASNMVNIKKPITCCTSDGRPLSPRHNHISCAPITIPRTDPFYKKFFHTCMNYVRSLPAMKADCTFGSTEQMNQASHFLDGSLIYGSTEKKMKSLRTLWGGRLITTLQKNGEEYPPVTGSNNLPCQLMNSSECHSAGDARINSQPQLSVLHSLFLREHNRIADRLSTINSHWDDERIYQESRKIVIAEIQHITYTQWLPRILGKKYMAAVGLDSASLYSEDLNPSISNAFATAASPFISSMIDGFIGLYQEDRNVSNVNQLKEHFVKTSQSSSVDYFDNIVRGLATQHSQKIDTFYTDALTSYWYAASGEFGTDLLSLDIQKGRDHGIPTYVNFRKYCDLPEIRSFKDLRNVITQPVVNSLESVYKKVQDIDLLVGAVSEIPTKDAMVGPTLQCIIGQQFLNSKRGDRFFYNNEYQINPFTKEQLEQIRHASLARIFCDNSNNISRMQKDVFMPPDETSNSLMICRETSMSFVNLSYWKEDPQS